MRIGLAPQRGSFQSEVLHKSIDCCCAIRKPKPKPIVRCSVTINDVDRLNRRERTWRAAESKKIYIVQPALAAARTQIEAVA